MQTVTYPARSKKFAKPNNYQMKKSTSSAKLETLRRKTIRQDKYRPLI